MADIPQWRRKIPPKRPRTPMLDLSEPEFDSRAVSALTMRPPTPKKGLRPKLTSYLSSAPFGLSKLEPESSVDDFAAATFPSCPAGEPYPDPQAECLIDTIMCQLMASPYASLEPRHNSTLLQIFEAYRSVTSELEAAKSQLRDESDHHALEMTAAFDRERIWTDEKQAYKDEVKRLELIIAKGKGGVADVALARQDSIVRRRKQRINDDKGSRSDAKETVIEFLGKVIKPEDPAWSSQRATMRVRRTSPSAKMVRLSRTLRKKSSKTSVHADLANLYLSTPPDLPTSRSFLSKVDNVIGRGSERQSFSDDSQSTFSCPGDLLPEELSDLYPHTYGPATLTGRRSSELYDQQPGTPTLPHGHIPGHIGAVELVQQLPRAPQRKPSFIMTLLHKLRPQLSLEMPPATERRFSFDSGDDIQALSRPARPQATLNRSRESLLRKSVSAPLLYEVTQREPAAAAPVGLSPIECSPISAVTSESRRVSKIPSPNYRFVLAKPRQSRDDSTSSLLTAIKHDRQSVASSVYSSTSVDHLPLLSSRQASAQHNNELSSVIDASEAMQTGVTAPVSSACTEDRPPASFATIVASRSGTAATDGPSRNESSRNRRPAAKQRKQRTTTTLGVAAAVQAHAGGTRVLAAHDENTQPIVRPGYATGISKERLEQ
nr:hypothetical protein B0A51_16712 [Rachicladosporium sp. CCFEE 5018]